MDNYKLFLAQNREIETEHLLLRPVTLADAEDLYEYASDEENVYYVTFDTYQSLDDAYFSIANYFMDQPLGKYGIELKEEGKFIGTIDLFNISPEKMCAEIGYILNPKYHRKGYMSEAGRALLALSFETLELEKMYAMCDSRNLASAGVMKKLGMQQEAKRRHHSLAKNGEWIDMLEFAILKDEYFAK
ncbi:GNAT family protein [Carnobacteriaceae bacterium 52-44]